MSDSPFDDPDIQAMMRTAGIVHSPGSADRFLSEIAPLLADEGIDLDTFNGDTDTLNDALARATERHNLMLFSPTGRDLAGAIMVLRTFAKARADGDLEHAEYVLHAVQPDATENWPAVSHVIGLGLGKLDEWSRDKDLRKALASAKPQPWNAAAGKAARQILEFARDGSAFARLDVLVRRFGGLAILEGTAVAVAAVVRTAAVRRRSTLDEACDALLPGDDAPKLLTTLTDEDHEVLDAFGGWYEAKLAEAELSTSPEDISEALDLLAAAFSVARHRGVDPHDPHTMPDMLDALTSTMDELGAPEDELHFLFLALSDYVQFELEVSTTPDDWEDALDQVLAVLPEGTDDDPLAWLAPSAMIESDEQRRAAFDSLPIVRAIPELLGWLGKSRPCSPAGYVRRAEIEAVARMLGIDAVGVSRKPPPSVEGEVGDRLHTPSGPHSVLSMGEVRELAAWWHALIAAGVIEVTATRLRPGPTAGHWREGQEAPLELVASLVEHFVSAFVVHDVASASSPVLVGWELAVSNMLTVRLSHAALPRDDEEPATPTDPSATWLTARTDRELADLARQNIVEIDQHRQVTVPAGLRSAVVQGVVRALEQLREHRSEAERERE